MPYETLSGSRVAKIAFRNPDRFMQKAMPHTLLLDR